MTPMHMFVLYKIRTVILHFVCIFKGALLLKISLNEKLLPVCVDDLCESASLIGYEKKGVTLNVNRKITMCSNISMSIKC